MTRVNRWMSPLLASALLVGCNSPASNPLAPTEAMTIGTANESLQATAVDVEPGGTSVNEWFRTEPPASSEGLLEGGGSRLEVLFNMCQATDADPNARLRFTYDFDSDGEVDFFGHCRQSHVYETNQAGRSCTRATVCIGNRRDEPSCRQYDVCLGGVPAPEPTAAPMPTPTPTRRPCLTAC
jgi:hypothetical protein